MKFFLLTSKSGYNADGEPTKYHKYDGKDTFCSGFKNDGLGYEYKIIEYYVVQYNKLLRKNRICKLCLRSQYKNKKMAGSYSVTHIASPKNKRPALKDNSSQSVISKIDTLKQSDRKEKSDFDTLYGGDYSE